MSANSEVLEKTLQREMLARHPLESVSILERLPTAEVLALLEDQPVEAVREVWERLSPDVGGAVLAALDVEQAAQVVARLDPARAAPLLADLDEPRREALFECLPEEATTELRAALRYPADRAGALMDPRVRLFRVDMTVNDVLARLRTDRRPGRRGLFVVDVAGKLAGWADMQDIALAEPSQRLGELATPVLTFVETMSTREEVVEKIEEFRLSEIAVVDLDGHLLGVIRQRALVEAEKEQASVGIQTMVGVSADERALSPIGFAVRKRLPWLEINLLTAFLAAAVVGLFEETIAKFTALAILLPVVAGQSGNTGAQALAVTMRGLALREIRPRHWPRVVFKEMNVGLYNGIAVALTTALGVFVWSGSAGLTLVIGVSMVMSMVIAGIAGAAIPIALTMLGQDPAQSSSIVLTTVTDVAGFFSFLGIASALSSML